MKRFIKYLTLFSIGGLLYMLLEIIFNSNTHWTMGILGGICFILIGQINVYCPHLSVLNQMFLSALLITGLEFIGGIILNMYLNLNIWDYSTLPLNILGQVCLPFTIIWFFISFPALQLNRWICYSFFNDAPEHN